MSTTDLLDKLIAHERSARKIGSVAEANAFALRIGRLVSEKNLCFAVDLPAPAPRSTRTPTAAQTGPSWSQDPATEKQRKTVKRLYGSVPAYLTKAEASRLIKEFFAEP